MSGITLLIAGSLSCAGADPTTTPTPTLTSPTTPDGRDFFNANTRRNGYPATHAYFTCHTTAGHNSHANGHS